MTPPGKQHKKRGKMLKREEKSKAWNGYIIQTHAAPTRLGESKGMSIFTLGEKSERERPSEQIKFPIFKQQRRPKDVSEETSSVQTSGIVASNQNEIKCIKQWMRQSLFGKRKKKMKKKEKYRAERHWTKSITITLSRTSEPLLLLGCCLC